MTTVIPFIPSNLVVPTFIVNLDNNNHEIKVTWNISAQRYYINVYDMDGNWIITAPLVATPPSRLVEDIQYVIAENRIYVKMVDPTQWPVPLSPSGIATKPGTIIEYTLENFQPDVYNGKFRALHINETLFSFMVASDPGPVGVLGSVARMINLIPGFINSTMIYRNGCFEVSP